MACSNLLSFAEKAEMILHAAIADRNHRIQESERNTSNRQTALEASTLPALIPYDAMAAYPGDYADGHCRELAEASFPS
jgi:hypothetical protein